MKDKDNTISDLVSKLAATEEHNKMLTNENDNRLKNEQELRKTLKAFEENYTTRDQQFYNTIQDMIDKLGSGLPTAKQWDKIDTIADQLQQVQVSLIIYIYICFFLVFLTRLF